METQNQDVPKKKRSLKIILIILVVVAAIILAVVIYGVSLYNRTRQDMVPIVQKPQLDANVSLATPSAELFSEALRTDIDYYETGEIQEVPIYEQAKIDKYTITILVVIQDGTIDTEPRQTDMIFLASYNQLLQKFSVVAIPRDTMVPIEGYDWNRIGTAYTIGGIGMLTNVINDSFGLDVQNYVFTGTDELKALADIVGGVPATLTEAEAAYINEQTNSDLAAGQQQLTGRQAICYLTDKISDDKGDLGRAEKQLQLILDTFLYLKDNFDRTFLAPLFDRIFTKVRTNIDIHLLAGIGYEMCVSNDLTIATVRLPFDEAYTELMVDDSYAVLPEFEKNRILLQQVLFGKE